MELQKFLQGAPNVLYLRVDPILDVLGSPQEASAISVAPQRHKSHFQGAPNSLFFGVVVSVLDVWEAPIIVREPPTIVGIGSPHHFFREPPTFLQLRVVLLLNFRKPPSFLQGAPNILCLRVASILDVLGSPRHFSRITRVKSFVFREPPTIVEIGSPHHQFREPPTILQLRAVLLLDFRKPPSFLQGAPNVFVVESSVNIGCFREPPPFLQVHKSQKICLQGAPNNCWNREPPSLLQGAPNIFVVEITAVI